MDANSTIQQGMLKRVLELEECTRNIEQGLKTKRTRQRLMTNLILFNSLTIGA